MMEEDRATCPYCSKEFVVVEYGYRVKCPLCRGRIDVFPDSKYYIDTPFGVIGIWKL
ncbi:MAG: hypothetical protein NTZ24_09295 [Deltaproteobacteria bacterium]|nr:hypothetical protein [Deltaproteobacteria bacterium]